MRTIRASGLAFLLACCPAQGGETQALQAQRYMVATANPHASQAGLEMLRAGGSALDATIAAQLVLNLTEPQSSGIGGGAFILHWDEAARRVSAYDGRETAPAAARPDRFMQANGKPMPIVEAIHSGKAVGVPGLLRVLQLAHAKHGRLPWARLFEPAIRLAEDGFPVSPRLHALIKSDPMLPRDAASRAYFYLPDGSALAVGYQLKNPQLAAVLRQVALEGPDSFYLGPLARDIVAAVAAHPRPGDLSEQDLAAYRAVERVAICGSYRTHKICGMPPPSSGGIAVLAILGVLEHHPIAEARPGLSRALHLFAEAGRLAYADRDHYVGDPDFVPVPVAGLVDADYLRGRAGLIRPERSMGRALPGTPAGKRAALGEDATVEAAGTSHISAVDAQANAVAMTTTIESQFGSRILVRGFLLNNQLTDFSLAPENGGKPAANRVEAGKRPRSSMSPSLVFASGGAFLMTLGSPGGSAIINYVAKTLVGVLDWKLGLQQAIAAPNMGSRNHETEIEKGTALEDSAAALRAMGHPVVAVDLASGLHGILRTSGGLAGGADPRREGIALGD
ncbi:MAG: gamma-glutamyltransferase [Betaproteobacteria bacterium]|nr:gamma-glutamyltransferase [Betaproteobacteria bacterium]